MMGGPSAPTGRAAEASLSSLLGTHIFPGCGLLHAFSWWATLAAEGNSCILKLVGTRGIHPKPMKGPMDKLI